MSSVDSQPILRFVKLSEFSFAPTKGSKGAAGFDLKSAYNCVVPANDRALIPTDLQIQVPEGSYGRIAPRSGLAIKNFISVGGGVIDEDFRGNVQIILFNHSNEDFAVKSGDRIAQLICEKIYTPRLVEERSLDATERGEGGFGSTGVSERMI